MVFQNNLLMAAGGAAPEPITVSQTHHAAAGGNATQSFSSCNIGTAAANRKVVVCAFSGYGAPDNSGTPTIAGSNATWDGGGDAHGTPTQYVHSAIFRWMWQLVLAQRLHSRPVPQAVDFLGR